MNKLPWDYTQLAKHYHHRAPYSPKLIKEVINIVGLNEASRICDIGAGTGFLARDFAAENIHVLAIEPNDAMLTVGRNDCKKWSNIEWFQAQAEQTKQAGNQFDLVSFGSSFNVVDKTQALKESLRIAKPEGWFVALWNHRDLSGGLQKKIEDFIQNSIPGYEYGSRREDHHQYLMNSQLFNTIHSLRESFTIKQNTQDVMTAWASHATLKRQAGLMHDEILDGIKGLIEKHCDANVNTAFYTQAWLAQFKF